MPRRGHSTTIGKIAKIYHDRRASEIRVLGELLRSKQSVGSGGEPPTADGRPGTASG